MSSNHHREPGVYTITCKVTGRVYCGSSRMMSNRFIGHRTMLKKGIHHCSKLQEEFDMYGEEAFEFAIIKIIENPLEYEELEAKMIAELMTKGLAYNTNHKMTNGKWLDSLWPTLQIPIMSPEELKAIAIRVGGARALAKLLGANKDWIYRRISRHTPIELPDQLAVMKGIELYETLQAKHSIQQLRD